MDPTDDVYNMLPQAPLLALLVDHLMGRILRLDLLGGQALAKEA